MTKKLFFTAVTSAMLLASCGAPTAKEETSIKQPEKTSEVCTYSYNHSMSTLKWTAFKTTEKIGVSGTFKSIEVGTTNASENAIDVLQNAEFRIPIKSVDTKNEDRDGKIAKHFFGIMTETSEITGSLKELTADGTCILMIKMNNVDHEVQGTYTLNDQNLSLQATIDLANWEGQEAIASLNGVCNDLHKGADGISKLWPEVKLEISTTFDKNCK